MQQKPVRFLLMFLALVLSLPLGMIRAEPYEFTAEPIYDVTADQGIADPEAARDLFNGLAPTLSLESFDETYGTLTLVATFTNATQYPMQGYSFTGTLKSNNEELYGEFADYILMPGDTQRIILLSNLYVDDDEFRLESAEDFDLEVMVGNFFDSSGHVASVRYDAVADEVIDVESYPSVPLSTEPLMNLNEVDVEFIDTESGWLEYTIQNNTQKPITSFNMFYQDSENYGVRASYYETILPGEKSPDLILGYDGAPPDPSNLEPMGMEVNFYLDGRVTSVRYDFGPAMYRSTDPDLARNGMWKPVSDEGIEWPEIEIPDEFEFPLNSLTIENEIQDPELIQAMMESLEPEFTIEEIAALAEDSADATADTADTADTAGAADREISVTYTNTTAYPITYIDFSGKIPSSNKAMRFQFQDYILLPGETHTATVWQIPGSDEDGMESVDDFELSQITATFLDGSEHITDITYDKQLNHVSYAFGNQIFEWTTDELMDPEAIDYEIIAHGEGQFTFVIHNNSEQTVAYVDMYLKTSENHLIQLQTLEILEPGDRSDEMWVHVPVMDLDTSTLEPLSLMVVLNEDGSEIPIVYDYGLDRYQNQSLTGME